MDIEKSAIVCGAGGFIGSHLVKRLKKEGYWVRGIDLKYPEFSPTEADEFTIGDLRNIDVVRGFIDSGVDELYQLAADMGGAGYIFSGEHDADVMHNSALINVNIAEWAVKRRVKRLFFSSSACIYPSFNQVDPDNPNCAEETAFPAFPDSEYGWEKLFSERLYLSYYRNYGLDVHISRYHNIYGEEGSWNNGKEKAVAAICRKVAMAKDGDAIDIWGDGNQTRSFLYIDSCVEGTIRLMRSDIHEPLNIGSTEMITINNLAKMIIAISGKQLTINNIPQASCQGVRGRCSDNKLIQEKLGWSPHYPLLAGVETTYKWINEQVKG